MTANEQPWMDDNPFLYENTHVNSDADTDQFAAITLNNEHKTAMESLMRGVALVAVTIVSALALLLLLGLGMMFVGQILMSVA